MSFALDAHFAIAFLTVLCALLLGWIPLGQRVVLTVLTIESALGIAAAAAHPAYHAVTGGLRLHIAGGIAAIACYAAALRINERAKRPAAAAFALSFAGLIAVAATLWHGAMLAAPH